MQPVELLVQLFFIRIPFQINAEFIIFVSFFFASNFIFLSAIIFNPFHIHLIEHLCTLKIHFH